MHNMEIADEFEKLKISAFTKARAIRSYTTEVTLGPNASKIIHESKDVKWNSLSSPKKVFKVLSGYPPPLTRDARVSYKKYINELDYERQDNVRHAIDYRFQEILKFSREQETYRNQRWAEVQRNVRLQAQEQEINILKVFEEYDRNAAIERERVSAYHDQLINRRRENDNILQAHAEKTRKMAQVIDTISKVQQEYKKICLDMLNIIKSSNVALKSNIIEEVNIINSIGPQIDKLVANCKNPDSLTESDGDKCKEILQTLANTFNIMQQKVQTFSEEKPKPIVEVKSPVEEKEVSIVEIPANDLESFVSKICYKQYVELQEFLKDHQKRFVNLVQNDALKKFRFDCKKAVNIPVNTIAATSSEHLNDKFRKLFNLLSGKVVQIGDNRIDVSAHPEGVAFCMDLLAKKLILQGDFIISSNVEAAFSYAAIIVALWNDFPDFGKLVLCYFYKLCPYIVPIYLPRTAGQTDEEYYRSLGYLYVDGQVENQMKFLKRMSGIMRLYCAILVTRPKQGQNKNPHDLTNGWKWLANVINMEPRLDITATLLYTFLDVVGYAMLNSYEQQFKKIITHIGNEYLVLMKNIDTGGPVTRLEVLLQNFQETGQFTAPNGMLPLNFW